MRTGCFLALILMCCACTREQKIIDDSIRHCDKVIEIKGDGPIVYRSWDYTGRLTFGTASHYVIVDGENLIVNDHFYDIRKDVVDIVIAGDVVTVGGEIITGMALTAEENERYFPTEELDFMVLGHHIKIKSKIYAGISTDLLGRPDVLMGDFRVRLTADQIICNGTKVDIPPYSMLYFTDSGVSCASSDGETLMMILGFKKCE